MALDDDFVEVAGLGRVQTPQAEVVDDQQVRGEQTAHRPLARVVGQRLVEFFEHLVGAQEEDLATGATGGMAEAAGEQRLAHTDGTDEEDVFGALDEAEVEEIADAVAIEGDGGIPVELLERAGFLEARFLQPLRQVLLLAAVDLILQGQFEEVLEGQFGLAGIGCSIGERGQKARELQALEYGFQRRLGLHRGGSPSGFGVDG